VPDEQQKLFVATMAGMRMTWNEIRQVIINPKTGKPISKETLQRAFAHELANGLAKLKSEINRRYYDRLAAGEWNAVAWGLKHICGYREDPMSVAVEMKTGTVAARVTFHLPDPGRFAEPRPLPPAEHYVDAVANKQNSGVPLVSLKPKGFDWR
jgi:hypothetical protein